jgi:hypothetical protein
LRINRKPNSYNYSFKIIYLEDEDEKEEKINPKIALLHMYIDSLFFFLNFARRPDPSARGINCRGGIK